MIRARQKRINENHFAAIMLSKLNEFKLAATFLGNARKLLYLTNKVPFPVNIAPN